MSALSAEDFESALVQFGLARMAEIYSLPSGDLVGMAQNKNGALCWARVMVMPLGFFAGGKWSGEIDAVALAVPKPVLIQQETWTEGDITYRLLCTSLTESPAVSREPTLGADAPAVTIKWMADLRSWLERLEAVPTERVACATDAFLETIDKTWGLTFPVERSSTAHGNLHWANVTAPLLSITGWDSWGVAPQSYDIGFLLAQSVLVPRMSLMIEAQFNDRLLTPEGKASVLYACAVLLQEPPQMERGDALAPALEALALRYRT